jgi:amino acid adenylation domain-containing protein
MSVQAKTSASAEMVESIPGLIALRAAECPDAIAIEEGTTALTYAELDDAVARVASGLLEAGVEPEEPVEVCLPRGWRAICAFLGTLRAGAAYLPLGDSQPVARRRRLRELAGARLTIEAPGERESANDDASHILDVERLLGHSAGPAPLQAVDPQRLAYVLFTSGSTGEPKGVEITHANMLQLLAWGGGPLIPQPGDTVLGVAPNEFDISVLETIGALTAGARLVLAPAGRPDPRAVGELIAERGITYAFFAAGLFEQVVRAALPRLGGLRLVAAGGDVMSPDAARAVREAHPGVRVLNAYGPTETSIVATCFEVAEPDGSPLPIGRALPGYELHVLDPDGDPVPEGEAGELWIGGPGVARGYRNDTARSAERFPPDPFSDRVGARLYGSGDVVRRREDGELLFLGRIDDQVKIAGHRIEPGEVEQALGTHPDVRHAAVVAREDVAGHKRLVAYAVPRNGSAETGLLMEHLAQRLPRYMLPATIELLPELPLTPRGKVDRAALPAPRRVAAAAEATGGVAAIAELIAELLELEEVGPDEDFFALGADSLLAIQLLGRLRERTGANLNIDAVFEARTARALAARVEAEDARRPRREPLRWSAEAGPAPATFAQRRAWLFERANPDSLSYQFACFIDLRGELDQGALEAALGDLIQRHESLRTSIVERGGEPVQLVHEEVPLPLDHIDLREAEPTAWPRVLRRRVRRRIALEQAPLLHWTLVRRAERHWSLIDVEHHAVHDGWSFMVLLEDLAELYSARAEGRAAKLPSLDVQLGDFARWERTALGGELEREQLDYWRRTLDPDPPLLELPADRPRFKRESFSGGSVRRSLDPMLATRLRELADDEGATSFMVCLAAYAVLLGRLSGAERLQIGSGLANRTDPAAERLVGMTVATVALAVDLSGDPSVRELLRRVRRVVLGAVANSEVPFDRVVEHLGPPRRPDRSPLVQTMFSFDDAPARKQAWAGLETRVVQTISNGTAKADISVIGVDHGDGAPFFIWEHSDLFSDATAHRLAAHHLRLLEQFVERPEAPVSELNPIDPEEGERLCEWSVNADGFDREATIPDLVARHARLAPDAIAVIDGERRLTYAELLARAGGVAAALRQHGIEPGDRVGVLTGRSAEAAIAQLGVLLAGAAYVPLDPGFPDARIAQLLSAAGARVLLSRRPAEIPLPAGVEAIDVTATGEAAFQPDAGLGADDLAHIIYTSGSTGAPKGVEVTHRNVARLVDDPGFADVGPGTVMLHGASPGFDAATFELWGPLANGGAVACLTEQPTPDSIAEAIERHEINVACITTGLFNQVVERRPDCLARLRQVIPGGDVLSPAHARRALAAMAPGARLTNGYGPTETTTYATTHDLMPGDEVGEAVPIGMPIQATSCRVLDPAGRELPVGAIGELAIGGDGVSRGYRDDPALTAERFQPDPERPGERRYMTGDLVRRRADGALEFVGRADRQLKLRGFRVEPAETEQALRSHPAIADASVAPFERTPGDVALAAYFVTAAGATPPDRQELRAHVAARLPAPMVPTAWVALAELPLNSNGKVDRGQLPAPGDEHLAQAGEGAAASETERRVIECFEAVLGLSGVEPEDDFFALGGHSLLAVELFAELERVGRRRLPLALIFEAPTPRLLAAGLGSDAPSARWESLVPLKPTGSRSPLFVVAAGDGNLVGFGPLARRLSAEQPLYGLQPSGLDGRRPLDRGIEAMAGRYLAAMRRVQPRGPYLLAGRCNGATVAFEMAQQLRAAGEEVPLLVALDSAPPAPKPAELSPGIPYDEMMETARLRALADGEDVPDPERSGPELAGWLREPVGPDVSRYLHELWHWREDLQRAFPDPLGTDAAALADFAWAHATGELTPELLLPTPSPRCRTADGHCWDWAMAVAWGELGRIPANPLASAGWRELQGYLLEPAGAPGVNRSLLAASRRDDLRSAFPDPHGESAPALLDWAWAHGIDQGLAADLLPQPSQPLARTRRIELGLRSARQALGRTWSVGSRRLAGLSREAKLEGAHLLERHLRRPLPGAGVRTIHRSLAAARKARASYRADPWPNGVVLISSEEFREKSAYLGWQARARGGVRRFELPHGHIEMLREPGVDDLAACLEQRIAEALHG